MKLWFAVCEEKYKGDEPAFFDSSDFEWAEYVVSHWQVIRDELSLLIDQTDTNILKSYFDNGIQEPPNNWKTESFYFWSRAHRPMINMFPKTHQILKEIPGLVTASVNLLESGSRINPHYGDTNAIYRCHLGLKIPEGLPKCGFQVKNEERSWQEGNMIIFLDAYTHHAFNYSDSGRYILQLDIIRPEFRNQRDFICSKVLGATRVYGYIGFSPLARKWFENLPNKLKCIIVILPQLYEWLFVVLQRLVYKTYLKK